MNDLAWLHSKRANRARGAKSEAEWAQEAADNQPPERRVPASLDPRSFDHKVGMIEEDMRDPTLERARRAFASYGEKLKGWHERERAIYSNKYENRDKKRMLVSKMVHDELDRGTDLPTDAYHDVRRAIQDIDKDIARTFRNRMKADEAREVRQHIKAMTKAERRKFLASADDDVVASVLATKPFLSGLSDAEAMKIRHDAELRWFPDQVERRGKLQRALEVMDAANLRYFKEFPKLIDKDLPDYEKQQEAMARAVKGGAAA